MQPTPQATTTITTTVESLDVPNGTIGRISCYLNGNGGTTGGHSTIAMATTKQRKKMFNDNVLWLLWQWNGNWLLYSILFVICSLISNVLFYSSLLLSFASDETVFLGELPVFPYYKPGNATMNIACEIDRGGGDGITFVLHLFSFGTCILVLVLLHLLRIPTIIRVASSTTMEIGIKNGALSFAVFENFFDWELNAFCNILWIVMTDILIQNDRICELFCNLIIYSLGIYLFTFYITFRMTSGDPTSFYGESPLVRDAKTVEKFDRVCVVLSLSQATPQAATTSITVESTDVPIGTIDEIFCYSNDSEGTTPRNSRTTMITTTQSAKMFNNSVFWLLWQWNGNWIFYSILFDICALLSNVLVYLALSQLFAGNETVFLSESQIIDDITTIPGNPTFYRYSTDELSFILGDFSFPTYIAALTITTIASVTTSTTMGIAIENAIQSCVAFENFVDWESNVFYQILWIIIIDILIQNDGIYKVFHILILYSFGIYLFTFYTSFTSTSGDPISCYGESTLARDKKIVEPFDFVDVVVSLSQVAPTITVESPDVPNGTTDKFPVYLNDNGDTTAGESQQSKKMFNNNVFWLSWQWNGNWLFYSILFVICSLLSNALFYLSLLQSFAGEGTVFLGKSQIIGDITTIPGNPKLYRYGTDELSFSLGDFSFPTYITVLFLLYLLKITGITCVTSLTTVGIALT